MVSKTLKMTVLFLMASITAHANTPEEFQKLMDQGRAAYESRDYSTSLEILLKAEVIAEENQLYEELCRAKIIIGNLYKHFSNYGEALNYYIDALNIATTNNLSKGLLVSLYINISNLSKESYDSDLKSSLDYLNRAHDLLDPEDPRYEYNSVLLAINLSHSYNLLNELELAKSHLEEVRNIPKDQRFEQAWHINYYENMFLRGQGVKVQEKLEALYPEVSKNDERIYFGITELLARIYLSQNEFELAIEMANKGLKNTEELPDRIRLFNLLSNSYEKLDDYRQVSVYKDSILITKDLVSEKINAGLFESNKVKLQVIEYQNELRVSREKQKAQKNLFIVITVGGLVVAFLIYTNLRNRVAKHRQQKIIAENNKKIAELKVDNLKKNIDEQNRKLSSKALYYSGRNELIGEIIESLANINEVSKSKEIHTYIKSLKEHLKTNKEWDEFITHFERVNPDFVNKLKAKHPSLNSNDIRFICYIYMNLNLKEISTIFNITYNAAKIRKKRIIEKIGLEKDDSLYDYILEA